MTYSVKETFLSVQGEGAHTGRVSVFVRFTGCNLWSGREVDRAKAVCRFCDTEFVGMDSRGGGQFETASELAKMAFSYWPKDQGEPWVICTGGEPLLQLDNQLIEALHAVGFNIAVESNGTLEAPAGIDWLCISPKAGAPLAQKSGDELKLVYPQDENRPEDFAQLAFRRFSLQPLEERSNGNSHEREQKNSAHMHAAFKYCLEHPKWQLSLQTHKWIGVR
ncbi:MAG TPA: 7-carboxy-7-deazaguanine synthase [Hellea balneolensis]|uniref:7-carboxy-7-deazaguanine synthase n=1 Tax=Hellea balneolensis TaxID=287478 RepID=A0A7C3GDC5_9PROT|nr:7-carboxy-7-deazaguanine synthase [Hellea balneolensis]